MTSIYSRLFKYRPRQGYISLENFLTEGLVDLLGRFTPQLRMEFVRGLLPQSCHEQFLKLEGVETKLSFQTQFAIPIRAHNKRPDIAILLNRKVIVLVEVKIAAAEQQHAFKLDGKDSIAQMPAGDGQDKVLYVQSQLTTYSQWMESQSNEDWPGAVVFLTHRTPAPTGFVRDEVRDGAAIHSIRTWSDVGSWLSLHVDLTNVTSAQRVLACEFQRFLKEKGLMKQFVTSRDLSAAEVFVPSHVALRDTLESVAEAIIAKYPASKRGRLKSGFWGEGGVFWAYYYLNNRLNSKGSCYYLAFGIKFPGHGTFGNGDVDKIPQDDVFFFILFSDEYEKKSVLEVMTPSPVPDGWALISDGTEVVTTKVVRECSPNPDLRAKEVIDWAVEQVERLVSSIKGFNEAPIETSSAEDDVP